MSSSNYRRNKAFIDQYRKELRAMFDDIADIDIKVLNKAVNEGVRVAKQNTNVDTGFMRKSWSATPAIKSPSGATKTMVNSADYSSFVNDGHRVVNKSGETIGFIKGKYMLNKAISRVEKVMPEEFKKEIERVNKKYDR